MYPMHSEQQEWKQKWYTPFVCGAFTELFSKDKAVKALDEGKVVFLQVEQDILISQQIYNKFQIEIEADAILLAKSIDGVCE